MKHRITVSSAAKCGILEKNAIKRSILTALEQQGIDVPCEINVLIVDNEGIRELNSQFRNVDSATDVLSFPMFELAPGEKPCETDPETGLVPLGDMVISIERAQEQAAEFGHSNRRELCYLTVHSVLHLLGYDHIDEGEMKAQMRAEEEKILEILGAER